MLDELIIRCTFCGHRYGQQSKILTKNRCLNCGKSHDPNYKWIPRRKSIKMI